MPASCFMIVQGEDQLSTYTFNTHQAKHTFCKICGVQSFYIPRSNQDGVGKFTTIALCMYMMSFEISMSVHKVLCLTALMEEQSRASSFNNSMEANGKKL